MASSWLNNVTNALESLDQAAETALTTEEERQNAEDALEEERRYAIDAAIERDNQTKNNVGNSNGSNDRYGNNYEENDITYKVNHNGDESSNDDSDEYHFVVENDDEGVEDNEYVDDSNINNNTSSKDNSHFSPEAIYNQQSIANDLTDDLHAIEVALKNERVERQKDKEEADVRAEALMKANTDLTKSLTKASFLL